MSETDATETPPSDDTPAAEDPSGRLPVEVEFEVGKVELRLADIAGTAVSDRPRRARSFHHWH